jgi:hypothetical protein
VTGAFLLPLLLQLLQQGLFAPSLLLLLLLLGSTISVACTEPLPHSD